MPILRPKSITKTRTLSLRLPGPLVAEIEALKAEADAAGFVFDVAEAVEKHLSSIVKTARAELPPSSPAPADHKAAEAAPAIEADAPEASPLSFNPVLS